MKQISALLFLWGVVSAWAMAGAAEIAVHPLHIETAPSGPTASALKQAFQEQLLKALAAQAEPAEVDRYLRHRGEVSCWGDDGCIVGMAKALRVNRVLLVSVVRTEPWIIMSARILDAKGAELRNIPIAVHTPNADVSEAENFADGFSALFAALELPGPPPPISSAKSSAPAQQGLSGMRKASYVTAGVAAVGIAVGATFTVLYFNNHNKFKKYLKDGVSPSDKSAEALKYMQRSQDNKLGLAIGYAAGGASLAASLVLYFLSPEAQQDNTVVSFAPLPGGVALGMTTHF
jgi:hypothetical protein